MADTAEVWGSCGAVPGLCLLTELQGSCRTVAGAGWKHQGWELGRSYRCKGAGSAPLDVAATQGGVRVYSLHPCGRWLPDNWGCMQATALLTDLALPALLTSVLF